MRGSNCRIPRHLIYTCRCALKNELYKRVPNRFFGIQDLAYFTAGIQDFGGKGERNSGL